jgi:hypothetical protein
MIHNTHPTERSGVLARGESIPPGNGPRCRGQSGTSSLRPNSDMFDRPGFSPRRQRANFVLKPPQGMFEASLALRSLDAQG